MNRYENALLGSRCLKSLDLLHTTSWYGGGGSRIVSLKGAPQKPEFLEILPERQERDEPRYFKSVGVWRQPKSKSARNV